MSFPQPLFSLTRFQKEKPKLPCWVAGRFFKKDPQSYFLKSQGLVFFCKSQTTPKNYKEGSWIAVQLLSQIPFQQMKSNLDQWKQDIPKKNFQKSISPPSIISESLREKKSSSGLNALNIKKSSFFIRKSNIISSNSLEQALQAGYQTGDSFLLQSPEAPYKEKSFSYEKKGSLLQSWRAFLRTVEGFFLSKGLAYAETPYLVKCPGTEPHLKALKSSFKNYYLPTSPEIQLKKLLCQDWTDFFEIKTCFREEEANQTHQVEFHLLEWYRAFYSLEELMQELYELLVFLQKSFQIFSESSEWESLDSLSLKPENLNFPDPDRDKKIKTQKLISSNKKSSDDMPPAEFLSVSDLFQKHLAFPLSPKTSKQELFNLAKKEALPVKEDFSFEDLFFSLFLNKIETQLCQKTPVFIYNYPPQLRAFAQINKEGWANRFELYWKGLELANAFYEVTQFEDQKQLFQEHLNQRKDEITLDEELLSAMKEEGMPPCSGIALGLDRFFLALTEGKNLKSTRLFPF